MKGGLFMDITIIERKKGKRDMYDDLHSLQIVSADGCIRCVDRGYCKDLLMVKIPHKESNQRAC